MRLTYLTGVVLAAIEAGHRYGFDIMDATGLPDGTRASLGWPVDPLPDGGSRYRQRAIFFPRGVPGRLYWLAVLPFHVLIFPSMARNILAAAEADRSGDSD